MKNNIGWVIALILVVFLAAGIGSQTKKASIGRFQLYFGEILETTSSASAEESGEIKESRKTTPVCIRLDSQTGQTWIYEKNFTVISLGSSTGFQKIDGFRLMPFEDTVIGGDDVIKQNTFANPGTLHPLDWIRYRFPYYAELNNEELVKWLHRSQQSYRDVPYEKFRSNMLNPKEKPTKKKTKLILDEPKQGMFDDLLQESPNRR